MSMEKKIAMEGLRYLTLSVVTLCFVSFLLMPNEPKLVLRTSSSCTERHVVHPTTVDENSKMPSSVSPKRQRLPIKMWRPYLQEILDRFPSKFSSEFRNPCWYEGNELQCVPYFYQLGSFKCGTTDLWDKLVQHPAVLPVAKEPHWWALRRFGFIGTPIHRDLGDASVTSLWGLGIYNWKDSFPTETSPPVYLADVLHAVQPNVKLVVILRDPVDKIWTTYMFNTREDSHTPQHFDVRVHNLFKESVKCESVNNPSYCAFKRGPKPESAFINYLYQGIYYLYLQEWVDVFGLKNIHVMRLEDWKEDAIGELEKLFRYLELEPLSRETLQSITSRSIQNVNQRAKKSNFTMLASTRRALEAFYRPQNQYLAELLKDQKYKWGY